jgi:hypothetical protein
MTSIQLGKAVLWTSRQAQPHNDEMKLSTTVWKRG